MSTEKEVKIEKIKVYIMFPMAFRHVFLYPSVVEEAMKKGDIIKRNNGYYMKGH